MEETIPSKIESISKEVDELHPLLAALLPKMPRVKDVEYTHGTNEKGADFIAIRTDDSFGGEEYIGVIAKLGKLSLDFTDIERQIDECKMPRTVFGGKKKVFLTEVWVIVTGSISANAQEKIQYKFNSSSIKFISGAKLGSLVQQLLPNYWLSIPLLIGEFLSNTLAVVTEQDKRLSLIQASDKSFDIEQDIHPHSPIEYKKRRKPLPPLSIFKAIEDHRAVVIEGAMGAGKSKLLRTAAKFFSRAENYLQYKFIPVLVSYREFVDTYKCECNSLIKDKVGDRIAKELDKDCQILLLIDGIDEKDDRLEAILDQVSGIIKSVTDTSNIRIVMTSRYLGEISKNHTVLSGAARMELRPLSINRVIQFIEAICTRFKKSSRLVQDLKNSSLFKELPRSPIAAILLARLMNENSEELPSNMTELYAKYTELLLGRWDIEKGLQSQKDYEATDSVLTQISNYMVENQLSAISVDEARSISDKYLGKRNIGVTTEELFSRLFKRCEIVCIDDVCGTLYFKHRTFAEFFFAKNLLKSRPQVGVRAFQVYWMNCYFFYAGLQRDCPDIINGILQTTPENEGQRWLKIVNMPNYFMAAYLTPFDVIENGIYEMVIDMAQFYKDICSKKSESILSSFSKMTLLCILQSLMRRSYSFEFFKPAFEYVAMRIDEHAPSDDVAAIALFFLAVINIELDSVNENTFDFLLKERQSSMPLEVQLAIRHEMHGQARRSPLVKALDKRLSKLSDVGFIERDLDSKKQQFRRGAQNATSNAIDELYEKPIKLLRIT